MDQELLQDIDGFLKILGVFSRRWSPAQRTAFLAALAERWLGAYQRFTEAEGCGDPAALRQALDDAWAHAGGEPVDQATTDRHCRILPSLIPSTDDFDAYDALTAGMLVALAVESCAPDAPATLVTDAAGEAYTAVAEPVSGYPSDPRAARALWRQPAVQAEIGCQLQLAQQIASAPVINRSVVEALRRTNRA
jgi:uncharacterized protein YjaG (DUF416 family)